MAPQALPYKVSPSSMASSSSVPLEPHLALLAAVFQLAIHDAQHGSGLTQATAIEFLLETVPDWVKRYDLLTTV